jgi:putative transcriptional regulator
MASSSTSRFPKLSLSLSRRGHLLCTLLLIFSLVSAAAEKNALTAIIVTAKSELPDDNFAGSAVLVLNNLAPAPLGLITNRPTKFTVSTLFPDLERQLAKVHDRIYFGGPIEVDTVWFLVRASKAPRNAVKAFDDVYISSSRELLLRLLSRAKPMEGLRIFIGHAGWAPGQLEAEINHGDWTLEQATAQGIFSGKSDHPWPSTEVGGPTWSENTRERSPGIEAPCATDPYALEAVTSIWTPMTACIPADVPAAKSVSQSMRSPSG